MSHINVIKHYEKEDDGYFKKLKDLIYQIGLRVLENKELHVIIIKDECIQRTIKRQSPEIRYVVQDLCNNCGICYSQFLCPAIDEREENAYINSYLCLGCGICEELCPNKAIRMEDIK